MAPFRLLTLWIVILFQLVQTSQVVAQQKRLQQASRLLRSAETEWANQKWSNSAERYRQFIRSYPGHPAAAEAHERIGYYLSYTAKPEMAIAEYEQAIELAPGTDVACEAQIGIAALRQWQGRYKAAYQQLEEVIQQTDDWSLVKECATLMKQVGHQVNLAGLPVGKTGMDCGAEAIAMVLDSIGRKRRGQDISSLRTLRTNGISLYDCDGFFSQVADTPKGRKLELLPIKAPNSPITRELFFESAHWHHCTVLKESVGPRQKRCLMIHSTKVGTPAFLMKQEIAMSKLFISHSSRDKSFVIKLSLDLVAQNYPVWVDSWELELGDSLHDRIYSEIDKSSYLILVLSNSSLESKWVKKELKAALSKEDEMRRKFIIPIKINNCKNPLEISDRIYANFSESYSEPFEKLLNALESIGAQQGVWNPEKEIIPLVFTKGVYLRKGPLISKITEIRESTKDFSVSMSQLTLSYDEQYVKLKRKIGQRIDNIEDASNYTPGFESDLRGAYSSVLKEEKMLLQGVKIILDKYFDGTLHVDTAAESCHWYCRISKNVILKKLWSLQSQYDPDKTDYGKNCISFSDLNPYAKLYELKEVAPIDIQSLDSSVRGHIRVYIDRASEMWEVLRQTPELYHLPLSDYYYGKHVYKFIIPQMVRRHLELPELKDPLWWDSEGFTFGCS